MILANYVSLTIAFKGKSIPYIIQVRFIIFAMGANCVLTSMIIIDSIGKKGRIIMFLLGPIGPTELMIIIFLIVPYFLPSIIAFSKKHYNSVGVFLLNLFLGWTLIGWIAALIWSFSTAHGNQVINITTSATQEKSFDPNSIHPNYPKHISSESPDRYFCSKCGSPIKSSDKFCSKCGEKLD